MAKPPAGSSLLFGALADSGRIKERKNGSYRMVLDGVESINWFTDRPQRAEGTWKPQKLLRKWDMYNASSEPNAQAGFKADDEPAMVTFEIFNPKIKKGKMIFNIKPISDSGEDKLTGLQGIEMSDISLFINGATLGAAASSPSSCSLSGANLSGANLTDADLTDAHLYDADLTDADLFLANLTDAQMEVATLTDANLFKANLTRAELGYAFITGADLTRSNLTGANLGSADLTSANLSGANLTDANLFFTYLTNVIYDEKTTWPTAEYWYYTTCPDGSRSDYNPSCGPNLPV